MQISRNTGLVLEGGGMRGVFTSGVLDGFMKYNLYFRYVVAVSAGACNGMSYISRQPRRARISNIDYLDRYEYVGIKNLITQRSIVDRKLLYHDFPDSLIPFDYDAFFSSSATFEMVTTNCITGRACYLSEKCDKTRLIEIVKASSSLPYVSEMVDVDGIPMLDGGIADSIPVMHSIEEGHPTNVLVLTRNKGYRSTESDHKIPHFIYRKYPRLRVLLSRRCKAYNDQLDLVDRLEEEGKVLCIRPERPMQVKRLDRNIKNLEALYEEGFRLGQKFAEEYMRK